MDVNPELSRSLLMARINYLIKYIDINRCCGDSDTVVMLIDLAMLNAAVGIGHDRYLKNTPSARNEDTAYVKYVLPVALIEIYQHYEAWCARNNKQLYMMVYCSSILELPRSRPHTVGLDSVLSGLAYAIPNMFYIENRHLGNYNIYKVLHFYILRSCDVWDTARTKFVHIGCDSMAHCIQDILSYNKIVTIRPGIRSGGGGKVIMENAIFLVDFLLRKIMATKSGSQIELTWTDRLFLGRNIIGVLPILNIDSSYRMLRRIYNFDYKLQQAKSLEVILKHHREWATKWPDSESSYHSFDKELADRFMSSELYTIYTNIRPVYHASTIGRLVDEHYSVHTNRADERADIAKLLVEYNRKLGLEE